MTISFEQEVLEYIDLPSIPKKKWDGKSSFKDGVAIVAHTDGSQSYALCTFNADTHTTPKIRKVFSLIPFMSIGDIFVVPNYMDMEIEKFDLDEKSRDAARKIVEEVEELERKPEPDEPLVISESDWVFPEIHSREEAEAWARDYRRRNKIPGRVPTDADTLKAYLYAVKLEMERGNKKKTHKKKK